MALTALQIIQLNDAYSRILNNTATAQDKANVQYAQTKGYVPPVTKTVSLEGATARGLGTIPYPTFGSSSDYFSSPTFTPTKTSTGMVAPYSPPSLFSISRPENIPSAGFTSNSPGFQIPQKAPTPTVYGPQKPPPTEIVGPADITYGPSRPLPPTLTAPSTTPTPSDMYPVDNYSGEGEMPPTPAPTTQTPTRPTTPGTITDPSQAMFQLIRMAQQGFDTSDLNAQRAALINARYNAKTQLSPEELHGLSPAQLESIRQGEVEGLDTQLGGVEAAIKSRQEKYQANLEFLRTTNSMLNDLSAKKTTDMKEYEYAQSQGFQGSFMDYMKTKGDAETAPYELATNDLVLQAKALTGKMPVTQAKEMVATVTELVKNGELEKAQDYVNTRAVNTMGISERTSYNETNEGSEGLKYAQALLNRKDMTTGPWKNLWEGKVNWAGIEKDQNYAQLVAAIGMAQAPIRHKFFGAALTPQELEIANAFLIDPKDTAKTIMTKLDNAIPFFDWVQMKMVAQLTGKKVPSYLTYRDQLKQGSTSPPTGNTEIPEDLLNVLSNVGFKNDLSKSLNGSSLVQINTLTPRLLKVAPQGSKGGQCGFFTHKLNPYYPYGLDTIEEKESAINKPKTQMPKIGDTVVQAFKNSKWGHVGTINAIDPIKKRIRLSESNYYYKSHPEIVTHTRWLSLNDPSVQGYIKGLSS